MLCQRNTEPIAVMAMHCQWITEVHRERMESPLTITFKVECTPVPVSYPSAQCLVAVGWACEIKSMTLLGIDINVTHVLRSVICMAHISLCLNSLVSACFSCPCVAVTKAFEPLGCEQFSLHCRRKCMYVYCSIIDI